MLFDWPLPRPVDWLEIVDQPQTDAELQALRRCVRRGSPYGDADWVARTAKALGLEFTLRQRGRPKQDG
jgi:putative transposase